MITLMLSDQCMHCRYGWMRIEKVMSCVSFFTADATPAAAFIYTLTSPLRIYLECISLNSTFFLLKLNTQIAPPGNWEGDYYFFMLYIYVQPFWVMTDIQVSLYMYVQVQYTYSSLALFALYLSISAWSCPAGWGDYTQAIIKKKRFEIAKKCMFESANYKNLSNTAF